MKKEKEIKNVKQLLKSRQRPGFRLKKQPKATLTIKQHEQEPYRSIYFKRDYDEDTRNFFFR